MTSKEEIIYSKFMSLILRHKPQEIGLELDEHGYINTSDLIKGMNDKGYKVTITEIEEIVIHDDKQRYSFTDDESKIRANQGHSIKVNLKLQPVEPIKILYHGTSTRVVDSICNRGIDKQNRQYVHLSADLETAKKVGQRHGKLAIFEVNSKQMYLDGFKFYLSENKVWLTNFIPVRYLKLLSNEEFNLIGG